MNHNPKISIITPSYNQGQYIEQTIQSVLEQNYPNLEYIIIDGGSTDNTVEIIKKYEKHLKYWVSEPDRGQSHAINKGLTLSTGDIFNWINSDDYLEEDALTEVAYKFTDNKDTALLCGYGNIFDDCGEQPSFLNRTKIYNTVEETIINEQLNQQGMFYKLKYIKELQGVNETLNYVMDLELWFRFMLKYGINQIVYSDKILGNFRYHNSSKTSNFEEIFRKEASQVFSHIFKAVKLPEPIISAYQTSANSYTPGFFEVKNISSKKLLDAVSKKYLFNFYKQNQPDAAKIAYIQQLKSNGVKINKAYLSLFYRLFISQKGYGK